MAAVWFSLQNQRPPPTSQPNFSDILKSPTCLTILIYDSPLSSILHSQVSQAGRQSFPLAQRQPLAAALAAPLRSVGRRGVAVAALGALAAGRGVGGVAVAAPVAGGERFGERRREGRRWCSSLGGLNVELDLVRS